MVSPILKHAQYYFLVSSNSLDLLYRVLLIDFHLNLSSLILCSDDLDMYHQTLSEEDYVHDTFINLNVYKLSIRPYKEIRDTLLQIPYLLP